MQKGRALFFASFTAVTFVLAAVACDDEQSSKFEETPDAGGADSSPPPSFEEPNKNEEAGGPVTCDPAAPSNADVWKAPKKQQACTAKQLSDYYDACLTTPGPDAGDPCKTFKDADPSNKTCSDCIEPTDNSGPVQWHRDRLFYTVNIAGCMALLRGEPNAGQCPATYHDSVACQRASCEACLPQAKFADFQACQVKSKESTCATLQNTFEQTCGANLAGPDGGASDCFRPKDEDAKKHFVRVEGVFCGP